jgi:hypothetical protein
MMHFIKKYKQLKEAGYGREQIAEMLAKEKLSAVEQKYILETVFKTKP